MQGRWLLAPRDSDTRVRRRYLDDTLIVEIRFERRSGVIAILDFMPPRGAFSDVIRLVQGERGAVEMRTELIVRFGL